MLREKKIHEFAEVVIPTVIIVGTMIMTALAFPPVLWVIIEWGKFWLS